MIITYYLDVVSSWCHWAEPAWTALKQRFQDAVRFDWRVALLDAEALPASVAQEDWFYRRSGTIVRSPYRLDSGWLEPERKEYLAPNCAAEAARDLGAADDRVRLALAHAALREGRKVGRWEESVAIAAAAGNLNPAALLKLARSTEIERRVRASTAEFKSFQINQRPAFVLESVIGDRAVFSGFWRAEPLVVAVEAMLADAAAYASWKAHCGDPPPN